MTGPAGFPGGTAVSRLRVYDSASVDGVHGGTPHLHTVSTEGYIVVAGAGALQTISADGYAERPLAPGTVLWFTPGTVHRLVNHGGLELLVVMANAGLPEAGDAVMTFPDEVLADPERYRRAATLPDALAAGPDPSADDPAARSSADATALAERVAAARARRDLGVTGFLTLRAAVEAGDTAALERLHAHATRLVAPHSSTWRSTWETGVGAETRATDAALTALTHGRAPHLAAAAVTDAPAHPGAVLGMCGHLTTFDLTIRPSIGAPA